MIDDFFANLPALTPLVVMAVIFAVTFGVDAVLRVRRLRFLRGRSLAVIFGTLGLLVFIAFLFAVGLEDADPIASVTSMFLTLASLIVTVWTAWPTEATPPPPPPPLVAPRSEEPAEEFQNG
ncbi:hypothetical protein [Catenuloplanes japonicus]|uniref:hypothetical protein n=1 Tax=Catenuloplanes japonicus TaxID=33876 RepID=UPI000524EADA|nr:hypothetical protein [Catenuloplanes japonicus]